MKIENSTKWNTRDLRRLFSKCIWEVKKIEGTGDNRKFKIFVKNDFRYPKNIRGRGGVGYYKITMKIGVDVDFSNIERRIRLARLFIHEIYHNLGWRNQDARNYANDWTADWDVSWVENYLVGKDE